MNALLDRKTNDLVLLKRACDKGYVHMTKKEWDEMEELDSMFILHLDKVEYEQREEERKNKGGPHTATRSLISGIAL